jgi:hypothetical protein
VVDARSAGEHVAGEAASTSKAHEVDLAPSSPAEHPEWDRLASLDGAQCRANLTAMAIRFRPMPDRLTPDAQGCGSPHGVVVSRGPTGITYAPPLVIDCSLAAELPAIEARIQASAEAHLGSPIRSVTTLGSYNCRPVRGGLREHLSEHAVGNAIDLAGFVPRRGRAVSVVRDYRPLEDVPSTVQGTFLRAVYRSLREERGLSHVIGPETRLDHRDHLHLDRGEPWWHFWNPLGG